MIWVCNEYDDDDDTYGDDAYDDVYDVYVDDAYDDDDDDSDDVYDVYAFQLRPPSQPPVPSS